MKIKLISSAIALFFTYSANACTGISLTTVDNNYIQARTIEWGENYLNSKLVVSSRNHSYTSILPDSQKGLSWISKYNFAGISVSEDRFIAEGLNEEGLSAGLFYFKNYGSLDAFNPKSINNNITDMDFVRWMLTQFKTVDEVEKALSSVKIVPVYLDDKGNPSPTAHWRVSDKLGNNIVIEITDNGKVNIFKNTAKVITNAPGYQWHITNLNNYINLHPGASPKQKFNDVDAFSFGAGTASVGLPGDTSPTSRFVRAAFYVNSAPTMETGDKAISQAFHILNNFDIPIGSDYKNKKQIPDLPSGTQWTSVIDQTEGLLFYKTMYDSRIKKIDLNKLKFIDGKEEVRLLDDGKFYVKDMTLG